ncbi:hypothetical protein [Streptomyces sp. F001]|uniref:hypothetical protein n=1 Tax=Streptomyces sp. F001 TaxID=1510026 RepID=UPI0019D2E922|nr:hypothetical protein [Streptomyces sp. F001]
MGFSLFYFADDGEAEGDRYHLLMEGARFADEHGLAVWMPERQRCAGRAQFPLFAALTSQLGESGS